MGKRAPKRTPPKRRTSKQSSSKRSAKTRGTPAKRPEQNLSERVAALLASIEAKPGAVAKPMSAPRATTPSFVIYKVMEKMFAIVTIRGTEYVVVKCDPSL